MGQQTDPYLGLIGSRGIGVEGFWDSGFERLLGFKWLTVKPPPQRNPASEFLYVPKHVRLIVGAYFVLGCRGHLLLWAGDCGYKARRLKRIRYVILLSGALPSLEWVV